MTVQACLYWTLLETQIVCFLMQWLSKHVIEMYTHLHHTFIYLKKRCVHCVHGNCIFTIVLQNLHFFTLGTHLWPLGVDCWYLYLLEQPLQGGLNMYHQSMFWGKIVKIATVKIVVSCTPDREILRFTPCEKFLSHPRYLTPVALCVQVFFFNIGCIGRHVISSLCTHVTMTSKRFNSK